MGIGKQNKTTKTQVSSFRFSPADFEYRNHQFSDGFRLSVAV